MDCFHGDFYEIDPFTLSFLWGESLLFYPLPLRSFTSYNVDLHPFTLDNKAVADLKTGQQKHQRDHPNHCSKQLWTEFLSYWPRFVMLMIVSMFGFRLSVGLHKEQTWSAQASPRSPQAQLMLQAAVDKIVRIFMFTIVSMRRCGLCVCQHKEQT